MASELRGRTMSLRRVRPLPRCAGRLPGKRLRPQGCGEARWYHESFSSRPCPASVRQGGSFFVAAPNQERKILSHEDILQYSDKTTHTVAVKIILQHHAFLNGEFDFHKNKHIRHTDNNAPSSDLN